MFSSLSLRRGFQRFYLVLAIAWIAAWLYSLWPKPEYVPELLLWDKDRSIDPIEQPNRVPPSSRPDEVQAYVTQQYGTDAFHGWHHVATIVWFRLGIIAFGPPAFFYLLFFHVGRWIYRGFRKADRNENAA